MKDINIASEGNCMTANNIRNIWCVAFPLKNIISKEEEFGEQGLF